MSSESGQAHEVPLPSTSALPIPTAPPKRFLGSSSHTSSQKKPSISPSLVLSPPPPLISASSNFKVQPSSPQVVTPPKLIRFPTLVLTPVDIKLPIKSKVESPTAEASSFLVLPPPPPLMKMPISTRKEKRNTVPVNTTKIDDIESGDDGEKLQEPPRKRTRAAEKSGESSSTSGGSTTPRKIIQEIFGPDKSKRPKGKGRKKRRTAPTPKKKILADDRTDVQGEENVEEEGDKQEDEQTSVDIEFRDVEENDDNLLKDEDAVDEVMPNLQQQDNRGEHEHVDYKSEEENNDNDEDGNANTVDDDEEANHEDDDHPDNQNVEEEDESAPENDNDRDQQKEVEGDEMEMEQVARIFPRQASRRKAKLIANEKLKRLGKNDDGNGKRGETCSSTGTPEDVDEELEEEEEEKERKDEEEEEEEDESEMKDEKGAASVYSRRSTTEGSSKSGSSSTQADSESSGGIGPIFPNESNDHDRQKYNLTPLSINSEDDSGKDDEDDGHDNISESDNQEQKDSDVDSTYSWKPVRAAAAAALEQVTKNQGNGSVGLPGDAETKAAAAAERRARKINRYKGRNRRTLLFKSCNSKRYTGIRNNNRYSAQPTIVPKVYNQGHYFQAGDIVFVELTDSTSLHGQIKGLVMDHFGETSAGVRFLAPKHPLYALMDFEPINYALRYDIPEKLIKIEYVSFVMHLNLDYFDGHPSFNKIEKNTVYSRMGKSIHSRTHEFEDSGSDSSSSTDTHDDSSTSESENEENKKEEEKEYEEDDDDRFLLDTDSSMDMEDEVKEKIDKVQEERADANKDVVNENGTPPVTTSTVLDLDVEAN